MSEAPDYAGMIGFLTSKFLRNAKEAISPDTPPASSGMLDSFALIEVVHALEKVTARKIPASAVAPRDLNTVRQMFPTAERVGTPR